MNMGEGAIEVTRSYYEIGQSFVSGRATYRVGDLNLMDDFGGRNGIVVRIESSARIKSSMQADGFSPFEDSGRNSHWLERVQAQLEIESCGPSPVIAGYLAGQISLPASITLPFLHILGKPKLLMDWTALCRSSAAILTARRPRQRISS
jgi:hypothetical protein